MEQKSSSPPSPTFGHIPCVKSKLRCSDLQIGKRWKLAPIRLQCSDVQFRPDTALILTTICQRLAAWADDLGTAGVIYIWIATAAVDTDDVRLVFDGAGFEQCHPVIESRCRPVGDDGEKIRAAFHRGAEQFGKAQVVTNARREFEFAAIRYDLFGARD